MNRAIKPLRYFLKSLPKTCLKTFLMTNHITDSSLRSLGMTFRVRAPSPITFL